MAPSFILALVDSTNFKNAKYTYDLLPKSHLELAEFDIRYYEKVRTFEDQIAKDGRIGKCLVAIGIDSDKGDETEKDFDAWYRLQQPDMLSVILGYHRNTCYKLKETPSFSATDSADVPKYLALHEYDSTDVKAEHVKSCLGTEWSKETLGDFRSFIRDIWITIQKQGREGLGL
ncbi:hypothetical protein V2G26_000050 [Clonostachys chloroleuca]